MCANLTSKRNADFEFLDESEIWWSYIRQRIETILQFNHVWLTDTQRSAEIVSQTNKSVDHVAEGSLPKPIENTYLGPGLTWWGCQLPVHADIVRQRSSEYGMLRAGVLLGNLGDSIDPDLYRYLNNVGKKTPSSTLLISPTNDLWLCHASGVDRTMLEEASIRLAGILHRLSAVGVVISTELFVSGELKPIEQGHPCSGSEVETDYFVSVLFNQGTEQIKSTDESSISPEGIKLLPLYKTGIADLISEKIDLPVYKEADETLGTVLFGGDANPGKEYAYRYYPDVPINFQFDWLRNDPMAWLYLKHYNQNPEAYPDQLTAFISVNKRLWEAWVTAKATILGAPEITLMQGINELEKDTFVATGITTVWPAASILQENESPEWIADLLSKLFYQMYSQFNWINNK